MMLVLALQAALQSPLAVRADTIRPVHDALHYDITLIPADTGSHVLGEVQITWRLRSTEPVRMQLDSSMRVIRVLVDGKPNTRISRTRYARSGDAIEVPHEKQAGDSITTRVRYRGFPRDGLIIRQNQYGRRTVFADNWPDRAHLWLPSQDHPSDKATVTFHVQAPLENQVVANGVLEKIDTLPYGDATWHYRIDRPIPVYTMVVGSGKLARTRLPDAACSVRCVPHSVWTYPEDSAYAVTGPFRRSGQMLEYFSRLLGPFPYPALAHVESSTRFGGMENSGAIFYDEKRYAARKLSEVTVAHEIAHQWFGDAVTEADWHHLWLSEGFATYLSQLWVAHADGEAAFRSGMRSTADTVLRSRITGRPILDTAQADLMGLLNTNNYQKGAWVLHQLRSLVGDSAFFAGLRRFYLVHRDSTVLSSDFSRIMSQASGQDLEWYFRQALTQPGYPVLDLRWTHDGRRLTLDVEQKQPSEWGTYRIPNLDVVIDGTRAKIEVNGRQTRRIIDGIARTPRKLEVDPDGWWLLKYNVSGKQ
jgi:aminopeptidase N